MINSLEVDKRSLDKKPRVLREEMSVPGILYGKDIQRSIPVKIASSRLKKELKRKGELYQVAFDKDRYIVKVASLQKDPISRKIVHFSLHQLSQSDDIDIEIPLSFKGEATGKKEGGVLITMLEKLNVTGRIKDIPDVIDVKIDKLEIGDSLTVADIKVKGKVVINNDPEEVIIVCRPPTVVIEESDEAEENETIEVISEATPITSEVM